MKQIEVKLILTYNDDEWHNQSPASIQWFKDFVLTKDVILHSKVFNRVIGKTELIDVKEVKTE